MRNYLFASFFSCRILQSLLVSHFSISILIVKREELCQLKWPVLLLANLLIFFLVFHHYCPKINWDYAFYCLILTFLSVCAFFPVKFIDFKIGAASGYIRFEEPEAAQKARAAAVLSEQGGVLVKNYIAILEPVTGRQKLLSSYFLRLYGSSVREIVKFIN